MFARGDLVIVVGATLTKEGITGHTYEMANVAHVGKHELLVVPVNSRYSLSSKAYIVSKHSCQKVRKRVNKTHIRRISPSPGDLVLECKIDYDKYKTRVGLLMEITDRPGKRIKAKLLHDNEVIEVNYDDLIILENDVNK